jgi:putrescine:ornithine antiporter
MTSRQTMTLRQLTLVVMLHMMGTALIILPASMAQVGAVSVLSWMVTAVGAMATAYGFAHAGLFNQRPGGLAAYAEDAYGRPGYFQASFLYVFSLTIANVAIAVAAIGHLAPFIPSLSSTALATCVGAIALLWLTILANVGGPGVIGRIGSIAACGVILPAGLLSLVGWAWFDTATFAAAWNPQRLNLSTAVGSSTALTVWAFVGLESAAQSSGAVERPKRDVPLACLFGTLAAAMIYVLSTTVVHGIVPNTELVNATSPFALAYGRLFGPEVGSIVMLLMAVACLGSVLGWQFTLAQTGKSAAEAGLFPALFAATNRMGAPVAGMVVVGGVQSLLALTTISAGGGFSALVNLRSSRTCCRTSWRSPRCRR